MIPKRCVLMLALSRSEIDMAIASCSQLATTRPGAQSTLTAVVAHAIHGDVVDHRPVIDVGDVNTAQV